MLHHLALLLMTALAPAQDAPAAAAPSFDARFAEAERDPARVVALIVDVSAELARVDAEIGRQLADRLEPFCKRAFFGPEKLPGMEELGLESDTIRQG
jgi:hypothetical protein